MTNNLLGKITGLSKINKTILLSVILLLSLTNVLNVLLNLSPVKQFDQKGEEYINSTLVRAGASFVVARSLNGVISMFQDSTVDITPAGVGVTFAVGEVLDPVNDMVEKVSYILFLSTISLSIQKLILELSQVVSVNILFSLAIVYFILGTWFDKQGKINFIAIGGKLTCIAILIRLLIPTIGIINETIYNNYFADQFEESISQIEHATSKIEKIRIIEADEQYNNKQVEKKGVFSKINFIKESLSMDSIKNKLSLIKLKLKEIKDNVAELFDEFISISSIFLIQTICIPLCTLFIMKKTMDTILGKNISTKIVDNVENMADLASNTDRVSSQLNPRIVVKSNSNFTRTHDHALCVKPNE